jgi:leucyl/phenylalanyl-tRNA---protein transferase
VPVEPEAPRWVLPDLLDLPEGQEKVALGADLSPGMLLAGYRRGLFAMPDGREIG